jgi:hypothetical protein
MTQDQTTEYRLIQQRIEHERELREENSRQLKVALDLQAREYERRLEDLNGAHRRQADDRALFVKQEIFDIYCRSAEKWREEHITEQNTWRSEHTKENDEWKLAISTELATRKGEESQIRRSWTIVVVVSTVVINLIALVLAFIIHAARP